MKRAATDVLLVVDVQNDFCAGGRLAVPDGDAVVPLINRLARRFEHIVTTQDWHPDDHLSFAAHHPGREPFQTITLDYGEQVLWPHHCTWSSEGAAFHPELELPHTQLIIRKGFRREIDSYSAFFENDKRTRTGLAGYLRERGFERVFVVGLAFDFCVRYSAEDARKSGFAAYVIEDACRAIAMPGTVEATRASFAEGGIEVIRSDTIEP
jgi:nicotinamidase/pyrazinamidase